MSPWVSLRFLQTQSDARLLAAARQGHARAFEALVERYRRALLRYCQRLLHGEGRAEDALQQGLLQAWSALQRGTEVRDVKAWLYRIVHNSALDLVRRTGGEQVELTEAIAGSDSPSASLERELSFRQTMADLAALPDLQREALLRTAVDGDSHERVAQTLGLSEGAVRGLIYRARATLRAAATAITPPPVFAWAMNVGEQGATMAQRLGTLGGGSGSIGLASLLVKGGAAVVTAGALVAGAATVHHAVAAPARPAHRQHASVALTAATVRARSAPQQATPGPTVPPRAQATPPRGPSARPRPQRSEASAGPPESDVNLQQQQQQPIADGPPPASRQAPLQTRQPAPNGGGNADVPSGGDPQQPAQLAVNGAGGDTAQSSPPPQRATPPAGSSQAPPHTPQQPPSGQGAHPG